MPAVTPAEVHTARPSRTSRMKIGSASTSHLREAAGELRRVAPVGRRAAAVEQARGGQVERAGAHRTHAPHLRRAAREPRDEFRLQRRAIVDRHAGTISVSIGSSSSASSREVTTGKPGNVCNTPPSIDATVVR